MVPPKSPARRFFWLTLTVLPVEKATGRMLPCPRDVSLHSPTEQSLMKDLEQTTCAHIPCTCVVDPGEEYCSDFCRDAGSEEVEIACECGHATCSMIAEEEEVA